MARRPRNEFAALADAARAHIKRANALGKSLDLRLKEKQKASEVFTVNDDYRKDFQMVTTALQHAGALLTKALEANKEHLNGLTEAQLQAQFQAEIIRTAQTMSDDDWDRMKSARAKAGRYV